MNAEIVIIDDQESIAHFLSRALSDDGHAVRVAHTAGEGVRLVRDEMPDVVFLDLKLPDGNGLDVLREIKSIADEIEVVLMTAYADVDSAVRAMKDGATDYLTKPVNLEQLRLIVAKALERRALWRELRHYRAEQDRRLDVDMIRGESARMHEVFEIVERVAGSDLTSVLIEGESGTGKQVIASLLHRLSPRRAHPFIELNCAAIPSELLESELFGYEKGAFTDAKTQKPGLLETADGGTLFLDEVGEMPLTLQVKLLKVLEGMTFRRVGGTKDVTVSVRIVSATNRDLRAQCRDGGFREDLYYRLKVVPIHVPALRERGRDVLIFAKYFLHHFSKQFGRRFRAISPEAEARLLDHDWPGNIRELRNLFEQTVLLEDGEVLEAHQLRLPGRAGAGGGDGHDADERGGALATIARILRDERLPETGVDFEAVIGELERRLLLVACEHTSWNQSRTARLLELGRDKLRYRMKVHGITRDTKAA